MMRSLVMLLLLAMTVISASKIIDEIIDEKYEADMDRVEERMLDESDEKVDPADDIKDMVNVLEELKKEADGDEPQKLSERGAWRCKRPGQACVYRACCDDLTCCRTGINGLHRCFERSIKCQWG